MEMRCGNVTKHRGCFLFHGLTVCAGALLIGCVLSHPGGHDGNLTLPWHEHEHQDDNESVAFNVTLDNVANEESLFFVQKLFEMYGDESGMTRSNLVKLLETIGMDVEKIKGADFNHVMTRSTVDTKHIHTSHEDCITIGELLKAFHMSHTHEITPQMFSQLSPAIIYQLNLESCRPHHHHNHGDDHDHVDHVDVDASNDKAVDIGSVSPKVWGYSCIAVLIISLVGLLGVAVIPIMQKVFYNHLLQFLVALAIGALSGDALLHLLPHSIMGQDSHKSSGTHHGHTHDDSLTDEEHEHRNGAWKGLVALTGILFFFIVERLLTIITVIKRNSKSEKHNKKKRCEKYCDIESNKKSVGSKLSHHQHGDDGCDRTVMLVHPNKALKSFADAAHDEFMHQCDEELSSPGLAQPPSTLALTYHANGDHASNKSYSHGKVNPVNGVVPHHNHHHCDHQHNASDDDNDDGRIEKNLEMVEMMSGDGAGASVFPVSSGHSHGSHHGHAHSVPNSVAAVAWMVILGDGIHNFSDGLAIGAAFASSITGGLSTSIAVFCHELPHEIGDFAVLLRAGMSAKQAIMYNCLSSILCFAGMLIGVAIGNITSASEWIFALVGGMFLYIALVDMLPEMTAVDPKKGENPFLHLLLQVIGIMLGSTIMLIIAIYEHDIKESLG